MLERLMNSPVAWTFLAIISVVSLLYAIYSNMASKKRAEISYVARSYSIVGKSKNMLKDFELLYKGNKIPNVTITQYAIWNSGNQILSKDDIVSDQPLRVIGDDTTQILDAHIIAESEESNKFVVQISKNSVVLNFDYVAINDGIVLQVIHTDSRQNLSVKGKIKGGKPIKEKNKNISVIPAALARSISRSKIVAIMISAMSIFIVFIGVIYLLYGLGMTSLGDTLKSFLSVNLEAISSGDLISIGTTFIIMGGIELIVSANVFINIFKIGIPAKLRGYSENDCFE